MFAPNKYQQEIQSFLELDNNHIAINALAGTGKTSTIVWLLSCLHEAHAKPPSAVFLAFNTKIAKTLQKKLPHGVPAMTTHSFGLAAITRTYGRPQVNKSKVRDIWKSLVPYGHQDADLMRPVIELVGKAKAWALLPGGDLEGLVYRYAIEIPNGHSIERACSYADQILELCLPTKGLLEVDFDDMLWIPATQKLPLERYDLVFADEGQDFNACQITMVRQMVDQGARAVIVGDKNQSMYGFRGSDTDAFKNLVDALGTPIQLPLPVNYRCGTEIIKNAQQWVPTIEACPSAPVGEVTFDLEEGNLHEILKNGDAVLCRMNAPLLETAFSLVAKKRSVHIVGRTGPGKDMTDIITDLASAKKRPIRDATDDLPTFLARMEEYVDRQTTKLADMKNGEERIDVFMDKMACVRVLAENSDTVADMKDWVEKLFVSESDASLGNAIMLSSVHRSKGLEWDRVFIIRPEKLPHPMAKTPEQRQQEINACYVAATRAKTYLAYVSNGKER